MIRQRLWRDGFAVAVLLVAGARYTHAEASMRAEPEQCAGKCLATCPSASGDQDKVCTDQGAGCIRTTICMEHPIYECPENKPIYIGCFPIT